MPVNHVLVQHPYFTHVHDAGMIHQYALPQHASNDSHGFFMPSTELPDMSLYSTYPHDGPVARNDVQERDLYERCSDIKRRHGEIAQHVDDGGMRRRSGT